MILKNNTLPLVIYYSIRLPYGMNRLSFFDKQDRLFLERLRILIRFV